MLNFIWYLFVYIDLILSSICSMEYLIFSDLKNFFLLLLKKNSSLWRRQSILMDDLSQHEIRLWLVIICMRYGLKLIVECLMVTWSCLLLRHMVYEVKSCLHTTFLSLCFLTLHLHQSLFMCYFYKFEKKSWSLYLTPLTCMCVSYIKYVTKISRIVTALAKPSIHFKTTIQEQQLIQFKNTNPNFALLLTKNQINTYRPCLNKSEQPRSQNHKVRQCYTWATLSCWSIKIAFRLFFQI